ncbi:MAG: 2-C-methyl-D-erythritol 4-phosphate cytidylyltransferase [Eubacterium sp.]|nr:2-C-methyl-D-erythritol 4-phosphate cytidylyltransferase [Eubacterium sp.]
MGKSEKCAAVIVAAGSGKRMGTKISKQFLELKGKPILAHTLDVFQKAERIDDICLIVSADQVEYVRKEIVEQYGFTKVSKVISGGAERYDSVYRGLCACEDADFVYIHDGVRPFVTEEIIEEGYRAVRDHGAAICGMPSKDTIKVTDDEGKVVDTPPRSRVWNVQTPQIFAYSLIRQAYDALQNGDKTGITDDAMVLEAMGTDPVYMFRGSYRNIKITTPEDLQIAEKFLEEED